MSELALDNDKRHALVSHFDRVSMAELVLVPTSAQPSAPSRSCC